MSGPLSNESTSSDRYANESVNDVNMEEDDDEIEIKPKMKKEVKRESTSTSAGHILSRSKHPAKKHHHVNKVSQKYFIGQKQTTGRYLNCAPSFVAH